MERKTRIDAAPGKQDLVITREFDLPVDLLFKGYEEAELVEQWMGTRVIKLESKKHGSFQFETKDPFGNKHRFNGTIHEFKRDQQITRTFEFENANLGVQLEFLEFGKIDEESSRLTMHIVYESAEHRERQLKMPFAYGLNMAHDRLQEVIGKLKAK